ncbi:MAG: hypothetical protein KIS96_13650 [Bauldia sp.]|nr:hypothetical protein [Bauldia sp.]
MIELKQVVCVYRGHRREVCPVVIGHSAGKEKVLTFQFGGGSSSGLPAGGEWRCLNLSEVGEIALRDGPWIEGGSHRRTQACVDDVDLDVNIHVRPR